jgi:glycine/D-amino acid oxidase-like deaminating enzyme
MNTEPTVIIGGGIIGLSTAIHLKKRGAQSVTVLERHFIGAGQSGRAAGICRCLVRDSRVASWLRYSQEYYLALSNDFGIGEGVNQRGYLLLLEGGQESDAEQTVAACTAGGGQGIERLAPAKAQEFQPGVRHEEETIYLWEQGAIQCDPMRLTQTLATLARRRGVEIIEDCEVTDILIENERVTGVQASGSRVEATNLFVANSTWGQPQLARYGLDVPVYPHRVEMAFFHVPASGEFTLNCCVSDSRSQLYLRPEIGNQIFVGWREGDRVKSLDDIDRVDPDSYKQTMHNPTLQKMRQNLSITLPAMKAGYVHRTYACVYDWTDDEMPILDSADTVKGLFFTLGCSGGGVSLAPTLGKFMADFIVDGEKPQDMETLRLSRFAEGQPFDWHNTSRG